MLPVGKKTRCAYFMSRRNFMGKVLIIDDDESLLDTVANWLTYDHHSVETSSSGEAGYELLTTYKYDAVILDWKLPDLSGIDIVTRLRAKGDTTPVLMLTGQTNLSEKVLGFESGTDDYLTKPFELEELSARLKALLRRSAGLAEQVLRVGDLVLDEDKYSVTKNGNSIDLAPTEFALLSFLMRHPNKVFSSEALLNHVWPSDVEASVDTVRTCVKRLRKKLSSEGDESSIIRNLHGVGYKLVSS